MTAVETVNLRGMAIRPHLDALAQLRIQVFREWPYLYEGTVAYERAYLDYYVQSGASVVVLANLGSRLVGASTALPLLEAAEEFRKPFEGSRFAEEEVFYFGESVLLPAYRGQGLGHRFFAAREAVARAYGARYAAFCAIEREAGDLRRPDGYRELAGFWTKLGYVRQPALRAIFDWAEPGMTEATPHPLTFWIKAL